MEQGKGRRTRRRGEVKVEQQVRRNSMREWLSDRWSAAQKRNAAARRRRPAGSGVTDQMREISGRAAARDPEFVVRHESPNRAMRRAGNRVMFRINQPHVNPARDLKRGRRLRVELRNEDAS